MAVDELAWRDGPKGRKLMSNAARSRGLSRELMEHLTDALVAFGAYDIGEEPQDPDSLWFTEPLLDRRLRLYVEDVS